MKPFHLSEEDFVAAHELAVTRMSTRSRFFVLLLTVVLALLYASGKPKDDDSSYVLFVYCLPFGALLLVLAPVSRRSRLKKIYSEQKSLHSEVEIKFDEERVEGKGESGCFRIKWEDIIKHKENDRVILLYESRALTRVIPKACFETPEELDMFLEKVYRASS